MKAFSDNNVFDATDYVQTAVIIEATNIAGLQPAILQIQYV